MAFSGSVSSMGLDEVFGFLANNGLEGALTIVGAATFRLWFREGRIICPPDPAQTGRLPAAAVEDAVRRGADVRQDRSGKSGRISLQTIDLLVARAEEITPRKSGRIDRGALGEVLERAAALRDERRKKAEEALHQAFLWRQARFEFRPGPLPSELESALATGSVVELDTTALLMDVARRADERQRLPVSAPQGRATARVEKALQGTLDGIGLAAVLQALRSHRRTGTLSVLASAGEEHLYFEQGEVYVLRWEADSDFAHQFLGEAGAEAVSGLASLGGCVDQSELSDAELRGIKDQFLDLLFWEGAEFAFYQGNLPREFHQPGDRMRRIALRTDQFLLEAIQRLTEWDQIRGAIGREGVVYRFKDAATQLEAVQRGERQELLTLIDGRRGLDDLVRATGLPHLEVGRTLRRLLGAGHLVALPGAGS